MDRFSLHSEKEASKTRDNLWMATFPGPMDSPEPCRRTIVERGEWCPAPIRRDSVRSRTCTENDRQRGNCGEAGRGVCGRRRRRPTPPPCLEPRIHPTALSNQRKAKSSDDHGNGNIRVISQYGDSTSINYRTHIWKHLVPFFCEYPMKDLNPEMVQQFVSGSVVSAKTTRNICITLRSM